MNSFQRFVVGCIVAVVGAVFLPASAHAATLFLSPATTTTVSGETLTVVVKVNSDGQAINDAGATIKYPADRLSLKNVSLADSIFSYWTVQPSGSDNSGQVVFAGGMPSPGFNGSGGKVISITWQAKQPGSAPVTITNGEVRANDGQGTDVLTSVGRGEYTITPSVSAGPTAAMPTITSTTYPDQNQWYRLEQANISWRQPSGLIGVSYSFDQTATTEPDEFPDARAASAIVSMATDGDWYFHLRGQYSTGWSPSAHFRLRHDQTPPEPFSLEIIRDRSDSDPSPQFVWRATDTLSGLDRYTISLDDQPAVAATSPATVNLTRDGSHHLMVLAYDRAGNVQQQQLEFTSTGYPPPTITSISSPLILLQPLMVTGLASAGDMVGLYVDGQLYGQVMAGVSQSNDPAIHVRLSWRWQADHVFSPGRHQLTAMATSPDGQTSVLTDPRIFSVNGAIVTWRGRPVATVALAPAIVVSLLAMLTAVVYVLMRLSWSIINLHRQELQAEVEVLELERHVRQGDISTAVIEQDLESIAADLTKARTKKKSSRRQPPLKK